MLALLNPFTERNGRSPLPFIYLSVIVWEGVPGAKSCGQPIWLKLGTEVGCDEIFQKPLLALASPQTFLGVHHAFLRMWTNSSSRQKTAFKIFLSLLLLLLFSYKDIASMSLLNVQCSS